MENGQQKNMDDELDELSMLIVHSFVKLIEGKHQWTSIGDRKMLRYDNEDIMRCQKIQPTLLVVG